MKGFLAFPVIAMALAACVTDSSPPVSVAAQPGMAQIVVTRGGGAYGLLAPVTVSVNGEKVADLAVGASHTQPIQPGRTVISVEMWSAPGRESIRFEAAAGQTYRFITAPRGEQVVAGMTGGLVGMAIEGGGPYSIRAQ